MQGLICVKMRKTSVLLVVFGLTSLIALCVAEKFTALKHMESILLAEHGIAQDLREYIKSEEIRLQQLKKLTEDYEAHSAEALEDPVRHLGNPVNAFLLVKRFTTDWEKIVEDLLVKSTTPMLMENINAKAEFFPSPEDLSGAATALLRLQDTYKLPTSKIALGELQGVKDSPVLSAIDCFELGRMAYNTGDHYHSVMWMSEALAREEAEDWKTVDRATLLDYLSFSTFTQGGVRKALNLTIDWLRLEPDHTRAQNNKQYYEQVLAEEAAERQKDGSLPEQAEFQNIPKIYDYRSSKDYMLYEALCRGEDTHPDPLKHKLTCQYKQHHPIYIINPLREEIAHLDPFIAVYHNIMTDSEIAMIKELSTPRLTRATARNAATGQYEPASYRISKSAWLKDFEDPLIARVSTKAGRLASLTLETVEDLQVVNYGIGGHYEPHYDFARRHEPSDLDNLDGTRIATVIFYMTNVDAGGLTVFPEIGVKLYPEKGSCALWYNLKRSGEGDLLTRHAGCPVLTGTKWVCNKWFHERGQEFIRPCATDPNL